LKKDSLSKERMVAMARNRINWDYLREFDFITNLTKPKLKGLINCVDRILLLGQSTLSDESLFKLYCIREFSKNLIKLFEK